MAPDRVRVDPPLTVNVDVEADVDVNAKVLPLKFVLKVSEVAGTMVNAPVRVKVLAPVTKLTPAPTFEVVIEVKDLATFILSVALFSIVIVLPAVIVLALTVVPVEIVVCAIED
jgi:hypothetical protein